MSLSRSIGDTQRAFPASTPKVALYEGVVHRAPATVEDAIQIVCDSFGDGLHYFDPVSWPERGAVLPAVGDPVLFAFSDTGNTWVLAWWPYG